MKWIIILLLVLPVVTAVDFDRPISSSDKAQFDLILEPVLKIYSFVKYLSSVVAGLFLLYSGVVYMSSGSDPRRRDEAKSIAAYVVIGLVIIWATPTFIGLLI